MLQIVFIFGSRNQEKESWVEPQVFIITNWQHGKKQIAIGAEAPMAISTQRDVEIVPQPSRQRHVPAMPELGGIAAYVREAKVEGQFDAKHACKAKCHFAITGEIEIDLHSESQRRNPGP